MAKATKNDLLDDMDAAARELLKSVNPPTIAADGTAEAAQPIDLKGRVAAFDAVTAYLMVKHKIQPTGAQRNGLDKYRSAINGTSGRGNRGQGHSAETSGADED